jgi:hypothetical protein
MRSIVCHHAGSLCPKLVAHLLDLRGLRFKGCGEGLNLLLLLCDGRLEIVLLLGQRRL